MGKENDCMIGILAAMEEEMLLLKDALQVEEPERICGIDFYIGTLSGKEIVLSQCGVGKVNSSMAATLLIDHFGCDLLINTGIAGGIKGVETKDIVIAKSLMYYDVDAHMFGYAYGQVPKMPRYYTPSIEANLRVKKALKKLGYSYKEATIYSGDSFVSSLEPLKNIAVDEISVVEMEGASIAQVCVKSGIDFMVLRFVSDLVDHPNQIEDYSCFESEMAKRSARICLEMLEKLA